MIARELFETLFDRLTDYLETFEAYTMKLSLGIAILLTTASWTRAQAPDPALMSEIRKIRAIDNHSHPPRVVADGERDDEFDALPCDPLEPTAPNTMTRPENPQYLAAWRALWGYVYSDRSDAHVKELLATKNKIRQEQGDNYPAWVLDRLGIDVELANRVAMGRGLDAAHYRWVPFDDALLFPLNNDALAAETPDRKFFFGRENMLLARYRRELGVAAMPATLAEYEARVVTPELERQKRTARWPSNSKRRICDPSISSPHRNRMPPPSTRNTRMVVRPRRIITRACRIICSDTSRRRWAASACLCTFTRARDAAVIFTCRDRTRCCSSPS